MSLILPFLIVSCSSPPLEDYQEEGEAISRALVVELQQIHSRDDLPLHEVKLKQLFNALVSVIIDAQEYKELHPDEEIENLDTKERATGDQLRIELNRVLRMEGGGEVIEKAQEEALNRLDAFTQVN